MTSFGAFERIAAGAGKTRSRRHMRMLRDR